MAAGSRHRQSVPFSVALEGAGRSPGSRRVLRCRHIVCVPLAASAAFQLALRAVCLGPASPPQPVPAWARGLAAPGHASLSCGRCPPGVRFSGAGRRSCFCKQRGWYWGGFAACPALGTIAAVGCCCLPHCLPWVRGSAVCATSWLPTGMGFHRDPLWHGQLVVLGMQELVMAP